MAFSAVIFGARTPACLGRRRALLLDRRGDWHPRATSVRRPRAERPAACPALYCDRHRGLDQRARCAAGLRTERVRRIARLLRIAMEFAQRHAISDVCILCADVERSIHFYAEKLGFRLSAPRRGLCGLQRRGADAGAVGDRSHQPPHQASLICGGPARTRPASL